MPADYFRAAHYRKEARKSARVALDCLRRREPARARHWLAIAEGEAELAAYWSSAEAPRAEAFAAHHAESVR